MPPHARQKVRLSDIARAAGVSAATVSRALRGHPDIQASTRERVREIADRLGYQPSTVARALRTGRYATLSMVLPAESVGWWQPVLHGAATEAERRGYRILVQPLPGHAGALAELLDEAVSALPVDGAIVVFEQASSDGAVRLDVPLPVVAFDDVHASPLWPSVCADNEQGGYLATRHLLENGRRQVVALTPAGAAAFVDERLTGFRRALAEARIDPATATVIRSPDFSTPVSSYSAGVDALLARGTRFDAIFAVCDFVAFPALRSLRRAGLRVPEDVAVVGFDDERGAEISDPALTSVRQPYAELGGRLVSLLIEQIEGRELPATREVGAVELIVRESSGAARDAHGRV